ncbi:MAG: DUF6526 family protein [Bacteroidota bacterium]
MEPQNYKNHIRYYTQHHFVFYPLAGAVFGVCVSFGFQSDEFKLLWFMMSAIVAMIVWLSFMVRQHYALGNQNRIARTELRFRYYRLTQKRLEDIEQHISLSQLLALRFASDDELVTLIERTVKEKLTPDEIKKAIRNWLPDYMRL